MVEERLAFAPSRRRDLVDADLFIPGCDSEMLRLWREVDVGNTVFWWVAESHILGELTECATERGHFASKRCRL